MFALPTGKPLDPRRGQYEWKALLEEARGPRGPATPMGDPPGPTVPPYAARRRFARRLSARSGRSRERRVPTPLHFQYIAHRGTCGKTRVVPHNRRPRPESTDMGAAKCVCCCRRMGARGRRAAGGTRGAVAVPRRGGAGVRAPGLRGATSRGRRAASAGRAAGAPAGVRGDAGVGGGRARRAAELIAEQFDKRTSNRS
jgi:hypothetical protein